MAWLYVPVLADLTSESSLLVPDTAPFVMWRGKPMPQQSLQRAWVKGGWIQRLSGLILEPSTAQAGVDWWISLLRDSHANPSAWQGNESEKTTPGTYGSKSRGPLKNATPRLCSWKTSRSVPSTSRSGNWEQWVSRCRIPSRVPPPKWVRDILDGGSSYLPTARTRCHGEPGESKGHRTLMGAFLATPRLGGKGSGKYDRRATIDCQIGGQVNPRWKEWFMGFPIGWTEIEPLETRSFQSWRLSLLHTLRT